MYTKRIYFSGGNVHELQEIFSDLPGVVNVLIGKLSARNVHSYVNPEFQTIEGVESVEIEFNPKKMDLSMLMDIFFNVFNPYADKLGVYYNSGEDEPQVELHVNFIANRGKEPVVSKACLTINDPNIEQKFSRKCLVKVGRIKNFIAAPEVEQHFLRNHPEIQTAIDLTKFKASIRF